MAGVLDDIAVHCRHVAHVERLLDVLDAHVAGGGRAAGLPPGLEQVVSGHGLAMLRQLHASVLGAHAEVGRVHELLLDALASEQDQAGGERRTGRQQLAASAPSGGTASRAMWASSRPGAGMQGSGLHMI
jgi:hypothetical protein